MPEDAFAVEGAIRFITDVGSPEPGFPPMQFIHEGELRGLDIDIGREIASRLGRTAEFVDVPLAEMPRALEEGRGDALICGLTDRADRREVLSFVHYLRIGQTALVRADSAHTWHQPSDLAGRSVAVYAEASNARSLDDLDRELQAAGHPPIVIARVYGTTGRATRVEREAVIGGLVDADFIDVHSALWSALQHAELDVAKFVVNEDPAGIALLKDREPELDAIAEVVRAMYADGTFDDLLGRWNLGTMSLGSPEAVVVSA